jgi:hypothetical protein
VSSGDAPTEQALLAAWDHGRSATSTRRAELLLHAVGLRGDDWPAISVGERNRRLLAANAALFGPGLDAVVVTPCCGERLELRLDEPALSATTVEPAAPVDVELDGWTLTCRPLSCADLVAVEALPAREAAGVLAQRCTDVRRRPAGTAEGDGLPADVVSAVADALGACDPLAVIDVRITCPGCGEESARPLEPAAFSWQRLEAWATRLLEVVHLLAQGYGWGEREILALSPLRRRCYLQLLGAA